jgi:hypothetical protein
MNGRGIVVNPMSGIGRKQTLLGKITKKKPDRKLIPSSSKSQLHELSNAYGNLVQVSKHEVQSEQVSTSNN